MNFEDGTFFLDGETARHLYHQYAKDAPIYDFHCHLTAKDIFEDKEFSDISSIWLAHDHYKWRAMRYAGVPEKYITGDSEGLLKFMKWAGTCEKLIGSPLYHWTHMELSHYFKVDAALNEKNAEKIYEHCNEMIKKDHLSPVKMINREHVKLICTTDDPVDNLEYHRLLWMKADLDFMVLPAFRPDKALKIQSDGFMDYIDLLAASTEMTISDYDDLMTALKSRIDFFNTCGCRLSDHSLEGLSNTSTTDVEVASIFMKKRNGEDISMEEVLKFQSHTLMRLASAYQKAGWVMQLHIGAMRNTNREMLGILGVDAGFDILNDFRTAEPLTRLMNDMHQNGGLPKTILYTLNPKDNLVFSTLPHCFAEEAVPGKIQFGAAWWFNDHKDGIRSHLTSLANQGMLAYFIGMLTDSRSFLSYRRHDYFRRILCSFLGERVDLGEFDRDEHVLEEIVSGICHKNIKKYLGLEETA
jgi:glucuronate isomerase